MKIPALYLTVFLFYSFSTLAQKQNEKEYFLLIGTYTSAGKREGIYVYKFDAVNGIASYNSKADIQNPSYLTVSKDIKKEYSVSAMDKGKGEISAFDFDTMYGALTHINSYGS